MSEILEHQLHGLGRVVNVKATHDKAIEPVEQFIESFEYESQTNKQIATKLVQLIKNGTAAVTVPINHTEMENIGNLMIKDKEQEAIELETSYVNNWQRVLIPIIES